MIVRDPIRRVPGYVLEDRPTGMVEVLGAVAEEAWRDNPIMALRRSIAIETAERGRIIAPGHAGYGIPDRRSEPSRMLTAEVARARAEGLDLEIPDEGIREEVLNILIEARRAERRRSSILARGPDGVLPAVARTTVALGVSALDPINIAAAFIPVIGPARFAAIAARIGVTGARLATGVVEGAVGAALVEPLVYRANRLEQADYDMYDSLLNIAFGGVLGGGLHLVGGIGADAWRRYRGQPTLAQRLRSSTALTQLSERIDRADPRTRQLLLREFVEAGLNGQRGSVEDLIRINPAIEFDLLSIVDEPPAPAPRGRSLAEAPEAEAWDPGPLTGSGPMARHADYAAPSPADRRWIEGLVYELEHSQSGYRIFREVDGQGSTPEVIGVKADTPEWFRRANERINRERAAIKAARRAAPHAAHAPMPQPLTRELVRRTAAKLLAGEPLGRGEAQVAVDLMAAAREARAENARQILETRQQREADRQASIDAIAAREHATWTGEDFAPEWTRDATADFEAAEAAETLIARAAPDDERTAVEAELVDLTARLEDLRRRERLTEEDEALMREADDFVSIAALQARAYRAAAACLIG